MGTSLAVQNGKIPRFNFIATGQAGLSRRGLHDRRHPALGTTIWKWGS